MINKEFNLSNFIEEINEEINEKEFNLSDYIDNIGNIRAEDVKEFIERLKEQIENWEENLTPQIVSEIIDKFSGDKLK